MTKEEIIYKTVQQLNFKKNESLENRFELLKNTLIENGINEKDIIDAGEKKCVGRCLGLVFLKEKIRINYRCGYGRYNYAPCIEVSL